MIAMKSNFAMAACIYSFKIVDLRDFSELIYNVLPDRK